MADRVASDHDTVETHRLSVDTVGRTSRYRIELPAGLDVAAGDVIRLDFGGQQSQAQVTESLDGTLELRGAYANARLAREDEGEDRLGPWLEEAGLDAGRSVLLDVLVDGSQYGLREPGSRTVYTVATPPSDSLSSIAEDLDG